MSPILITRKYADFEHGASIKCLEGIQLSTESPIKLEPTQLKPSTRHGERWDSGAHRCGNLHPTNNQETTKLK